MELIRISESKLKIALSRSDMERYSIDCDSVDYGKTETKAAFWRLLDEAKHKTGFDAASDRIFVQVYTSSSGGCEMYVTKLHISQSGRCTQAEELSGDVCDVRDESPQDKKFRRYIYRTESFDGLVRLCAFTEKLFGDIESIAFSVSGVENRFFLVFWLSESLSDDEDGISLVDLLGEYGKKCPDKAMMFISEHCRSVCDFAAVRRLGLLI